MHRRRSESCSGTRQAGMTESAQELRVPTHRGHLHRALQSRTITVTMSFSPVSSLRTSSIETHPESFCHHKAQATIPNSNNKNKNINNPIPAIPPFSSLNTMSVLSLPPPLNTLRGSDHCPAISLSACFLHEMERPPPSPTSNIGSAYMSGTAACVAGGISITHADASRESTRICIVLALMMLRRGKNGGVNLHISNLNWNSKHKQLSDEHHKGFLDHTHKASQ